MHQLASWAHKGSTSALHLEQSKKRTPNIQSQHVHAMNNFHTTLYDNSNTPNSPHHNTLHS